MSTQYEVKRRQLSLARSKRVLGAILSVSWSIAPGRVALMMGLNVLIAVAASSSPLAIKLAVDSFTHHDWYRAEIGLGAAVGLAAISLMQGAINAYVRHDLADRINHEMDLRLMQAATEPAGLDHMERPEFADRIEIVRDAQWLTINAFDNINALLFIVVGLAVSLPLLWSVHPLLLLAAVVIVPLGLVNYRVEKDLAERQGDWISPDSRLLWHLQWLATVPDTAKELRLFGLGEHLLKRHTEVGEGIIRRILSERARRSWVMIVSGSLYGLMIAGGIIFVAWLTLNGHATFGSLVMAVQVMQQVISRANQAAGTFAWAADVAFVGDRFLWLLDYRDPLHVENPKSVPEAVADGVVFENVSFRYPTIDKPVLHDVSFRLPAGKTVAVVGENGAGKTTLVKLLCRFYDPDSGRITVDGVDLRELDVHEWRRRFSVAFQDFYKFQLNAQQAVGVGELGAIEDRERVLSAVDRSGSTELVSSLPSGLDTQLGRWFKGHELSEGQWQRVALARGAMREGPAVLVLDEPTAALDAKAEAKVFELFKEMARPEGSPPPVTFLVSHRFSTVRMADLIIVMHEGSVEEIGTHEELMAKGGRYAELFRLQASRYT